MIQPLYRYKCLSCGAMTNSVRCPQCGNDTDPIDESIKPSYSIFDHAQLGPIEFLKERYDKARPRRFNDDPLTHFGDI